jgi:hypothetical protein
MATIDLSVDPAVRERIAQHYERKAKRRAIACASAWMERFAEMTRAGHVNAFIRRVERMAARRATPLQGDLFS